MRSKQDGSSSSLNLIIKSSLMSKNRIQNLAQVSGKTLVGNVATNPSLEI